MKELDIIDFHTHIYPPAIASKAVQSIADFYSIENGGMLGTSEHLIESGKAVGIKKFVVLPVAIKSEHTRSINDFIIGECKKHSEFIGFGTVHAGLSDITDEADYIIENGLKGIKMHPDTQFFDIDDERLFPLYEHISGQIPVILHCGDAKYDYSHPRRVRRIIDMFPKLEVIAAHFGGYSKWDEAYELLLDTNCWFDISSSLMFLTDDKIKKYINSYGSDRLLYGTDYPLWNPIEEVERFKKLDLRDEDREKIAYKNAEIILKEKI